MAQGKYKSPFGDNNTQSPKSPRMHFLGIYRYYLLGHNPADFSFSTLSYVIERLFDEELAPPEWLIKAYAEKLNSGNYGETGNLLDEFREDNG